MKKILTIILLFISVISFAQRPNGGGAKQQQIQAAKIGFITEKVNLTTEQAPLFWAIYNEFERKRVDIFQNIKRASEEANSLSASDDKILAAHKQVIAQRKKQLDLEEEYMLKILKVISVRQYTELQKAENNFKKMLLQRVNKDKNEDDN